MIAVEPDEVFTRVYCECRIHRADRNALAYLKVGSCVPVPSNRASRKEYQQIRAYKSRGYECANLGNHRCDGLGSRRAQLRRTADICIRWGRRHLVILYTRPILILRQCGHFQRITLFPDVFRIQPGIIIVDIAERAWLLVSYCLKKRSIEVRRVCSVVGVARWNHTCRNSSARNTSGHVERERL